MSLLWHPMFRCCSPDPQCDGIEVGPLGITGSRWSQECRAHDGLSALKEDENPELCPLCEDTVRQLSALRGGPPLHPTEQAPGSQASSLQNCLLSPPVCGGPEPSKYPQDTPFSPSSSLSPFLSPLSKQRTTLVKNNVMWVETSLLLGTFWRTGHDDRLSEAFHLVKG